MPGDLAPGNQTRMLDNKERKATDMMIVLKTLNTDISHNWRDLNEESIEELKHKILDLQEELLKLLPPNK